MTVDTTQVTFSLSLCSNLSLGRIGDVASLEQQARSAIDAALHELQPTIGSWKVLWGPAIFHVPLSIVPDNTLVVFGDSQGRMVIAVAATNPPSLVDWLIEDDWIGTVSPWPVGKPAPYQPNIATGALNALTVLLDLSSGGLKVAEFLAGLRDEMPHSITVTGHSLGGMVSPALALWLCDEQSKWDPHKKATIFCVPSAGFTTGDADFAAYYETSLSAQTTPLRNSLDIAPRAWAADSLATIPNLYVPAIPVSPGIEAIVDLASAIAEANRYTQILPEARDLVGTVNSSKILPIALPSANFIIQAQYQHVAAYFDLLEIPKEPFADLLAALGG